MHLVVQEVFQYASGGVLKLSRAEEYAAQIDIEHIKKLLKAVQARIDFVNLSSTPTTMMEIISNKELMEAFQESRRSYEEIIAYLKSEE